MWREGASLTWITAIGIGGISTLAAAALPACSAPPAPSSPEENEPRGTTNQSIIGGSPSTSDRDSVVLLNDNGRNEGCSGTLIAPNVVLTARHCVVSSWNINDDCGLPFGGDLAASLFTISTGVYATPSQYIARGVKLYTPQTNNGMCGTDIALILLDKDVPNAKVAKVRFTRPAMGETTTVVGFGESGGRRERSVNILAIGPINTTFTTSQGRNLSYRLPADDVATGESTCFGDSGGPLLDSSGAIIAITSRGIDDLCDDRPTISTVLAPHEALIRDTLKVAGHPIEGPATNAPPAVPNGTLDNPDKGKNDGKEKEEEEQGTRKPKTQNVASMGCSSRASSSFSGSGLAAQALFAVALAFATRRRRER